MKSKKEYRRRKEQGRRREVDIYQNRAAPEEGSDACRDVTDCEDCLEELVFAMKDKHHEFSIGLSTILYCLAIAEKEGYVPRLPPEWWEQVRSYYP